MRGFPYLAFFAAGLAALTAETAFHRALVVIIGNSPHAAAATAAIVFCGLALGSRWGGRLVLEQPGAGLRLFAMVMLGAGSFAAMSPLSILALGRFYAVAAPKLGSGWFVDAVRVLFASVFLLPAAFLWGAGFPLIAAGAAGRDDGPRRRARAAGWLLTVNIWGAATGALLSGYFLLPAIGVLKTLFLSAAAAAVAALTALFWDSLGPVLRGEPRRRWSPRPSPVEIAESEFGEISGLGRFGVIASCCAGLLSLSAAVLSARLVVLFFGNGVIVFPLVVAAVLLTAGVSAAFGSTWSSKALPAPDRLASVLSGCFALTALSLAGIPLVFSGVSAFGPAAAFSGRALWTVLLLLAPYGALGACLPLALRLRTACGSRASQAVAELFSLNMAGAVLGALAGSFLLIRSLGVSGAYFFLAAVSAAAAGLGWRMARGRTRPWRWRSCAAAVVLAVAAALCGGVDFGRLYRVRLSASVPSEVLRHEDGLHATITVLENPGYTSLYLDGIEEASTRFFHVQALKLLGVLPAALKDAEPAPALMIGFGAGISAGAALHSGLVGTLDVVDANPEIEGIAQSFVGVNGDPVGHPNFRYTVDDGRHYLVRRRGKWGLIIARAAQSGARDGWPLHTVEFYRLIQARLTPDGVFAVWVPTEELSREAFRSRVRSFQSVFPHASLWNVPGSGQSLLIATPEPLRISGKSLSERLDRASPEADFENFQIADAAEFEKFFVAGEAGLRAYAGTGPVDTDDFPRFQRLAFSARRAPGIALSLIQESLFGDEFRFAAAKALRRYHAYGDLAALAEAYALAPDDKNVRFFANGVAGREYENNFSEKTAWLAEISNKTPAPEHDAESVRLLFEIGDTDAALHLLDRARKENPRFERFEELGRLIQRERRNQEGRTRARLLQRLSVYGANFAEAERRGFVKFAAGDYAGARAALEEALALNPESTASLVNLADLDARAGDMKKAEASLVRALEVNPFCAPALQRLIQFYSSEGELGRAAALRKRFPRKLSRPPYFPCGEYCRPWTESWVAVAGRD